MMTPYDYRPLSADEVLRLEQNRCTADDWSRVLVARDFSTDTVAGAHFHGDIRLGLFRAPHADPCGMQRPSGVYRATLCNVAVGDDCRIADIADFIGNYDIGRGSRVEHVEQLYTEGPTAFGCGTRVAVLKEDGGREVVLHDELTAQAAYLQCCYRHDVEVQAALERMAAEVVRRRTAGRGTIGMNVQITHCGRIRNVRFSDGSCADGAQVLDEGTLAGSLRAPACVGRGVWAKEFVLLRGARLDSGAQVSRCLVGECSTVAHGFRASDCLFFSNCQLENGEACAFFGGPFTVSHHKSTLLIGGMSSFFNAGSATNQSNHAYKLGPVHYGILERGCRTGSNSYLLWPARIGMFSTVIGEVKLHLDTRNLPFSYIIGEGGQCFLAPGATLRSIGTWRDAEKWPLRDGRKELDCPRDVVDAEVFSVHTAARLVAGIHTLEEIRTSQGPDSPAYTFQGATIRRSSLEHGLQLYGCALRYIVGRYLSSDEQILQPGRSASPGPSAGWSGFGRLFGQFYWVDVAGMLMTEAALEDILSRLRCGAVPDVQSLSEAFRTASGQAPALARLSLSSMQSALTGERIQSPQEYLKAMEAWRASAEALIGAVLADGEKEFAPAMKVSSGVDCRNSEDLEKDFAASGACPENYPVFRTLRERLEAVRRKVSACQNRWGC